MVTDTNDTRQQLINSFKKLMLEHPFKKITIKMITDDAGVIRPTFYNHFRDKYEVFEVILDQELIHTLCNLIDIDMLSEAVTMIFAYFENNQKFYKNAFTVTGQNSFTEILINKIKYLIHYGMNKKEITTFDEPSVLTQNQLIEYFSNNLVMIIKLWIESDRSESIQSDEVFEAYNYLLDKIFEIRNENNG